MIGRFLLKMAAATAKQTPRATGNVSAKAGGGVRVPAHQRFVLENGIKLRSESTRLNSRMSPGCSTDTWGSPACP